MISKNQIKFVRSLQLKKNRDFNNCFVVEGEKIVDEIIQSDFSIYQIFATKGWLLSNLNIVAEQTHQISEKELSRISQQSTPNKVLAVVEKAERELKISTITKGLTLVLDEIKDYMPEDKPRYLMGVGTPSDILGAVKRGIDMFDCVLPTRSGRTGLAFTWNGRINIKNSKYQNDNQPLDPNCKNLNLNKYSKNYLNHLFNTNEILASMLLTLHNINFYQELMRRIRDNIKKGTFNEFHDLYIAKL